MTNDEVRRTMTRIADAKVARRADLSADGAAAAAPAPRIDGLPRAGDRVMDVLGGLEGTVESVGTPSGSGSVLVYIRLDNGSLLVRPPFNLMRRPTPPGGRS